ncbi:hypothetical protein GALL_478020 [mine drainage metagenome]|uniref:Uncharacterized protein n=1 Tax=mine drainage metagenome TaxID=410659 RepID=A0A1J5PIH3_9ZZZZ
MLIVMKHRNFHARLELRLDLEALRTLDILEIDATEGRFQRRHGLDHALDGIGRDFNVEDVDPCEFLEQDRLAFHDRLRRQRTDIAKAKHGGTVTDHGDQIGTRGQRSRLRRIVRDFRAGGRDARRIGQREVALVGERLGRLNLELTGPRQPVVGERRRVKIFRIGRHTFSSVSGRPGKVDFVRLGVSFPADGSCM